MTEPRIKPAEMGVITPSRETDAGSVDGPRVRNSDQAPLHGRTVIFGRLAVIGRVPDPHPERCAGGRALDGEVGQSHVAGIDDLDGWSIKIVEQDRLVATGSLQMHIARNEKRTGEPETTFAETDDLTGSGLRKSMLDLLNPVVRTATDHLVHVNAPYAGG